MAALWCLDPAASSSLDCMDRLEDRAAIEDQMVRYARATDWMETENHRLVFADECVFASPHSGDMHGVDAVVAWMNRVLPQFEATQHLIGNIAITFTGPDTATGLWYLEDRFIDPLRQEDTIGTALYRDRYVRTADGWKIARSEYDRVYEITRPIPQDERLTFRLLARTGRKPEARVDCSRWLQWHAPDTPVENSR